MKSVLSSKVAEGRLIVLDELKLDGIKTKEMVKVLGNIKAVKPLIVMEDATPNEVLSARNIPGVKTAGVNTINVYDILKHDNLVVTRQAIEKIQEVYI
jgi:large subunit ribosomal protein L4